MSPDRNTPGPRRPRCVMVLVGVAVALVGYEAFSILLRPLAAYQQVWFGLHFYGQAARALSVAHIVVYAVGAWGLWHLRPWARKAAMAYLVYLLASFIIWGVRRDDISEGAFYVMAWQLSVLPVVTFCLMYLYNGVRYFRDNQSLISTGTDNG